MNTITKIVIVSALVIAVGGVVILKERKRADSQSTTTVTVQEDKSKDDLQSTTTVIVHKENKRQDSQSTSSERSKALPLLVDLGAETCIPCKMMMPILEDLKKKYAGVFEVEFINVREKLEAGKKYGIRVIPTQIFFDANGKEVFRHEGFFSKEDILVKWKEVGVDIEKSEE